MISLVVHGGAWDIPDDMVIPHRTGVAAALNAGWDVLRSGGSAIEAVVRAVTTLENDETFDAGKGSFINAEGNVELDASIMDGRTLRAGAVAAVRDVRNPIVLARAIMEESEHILLVGEGARKFALEHHVPLCTRDDLVTARELQRWGQIRARKEYRTRDSFRRNAAPSDTVGAVALDATGTVASGTSTGGTPNKYPGRVGDSPLIGVGTYADSTVGGVSTTGWGESMIRVVMGKTVVDLLRRYGGDAGSAAREGIRILAQRVGGYGGVIALSCTGDVGVAFNTPRMARAYVTEGMEAPVVEIEGSAGHVTDESRGEP